MIPLNQVVDPELIIALIILGISVAFMVWFITRK